MMPYLNYLKELSEIGYATLASKVQYRDDVLHTLWEVTFTYKNEGFNELAPVYADTPEEAIRKMYLKVNPIPKRKLSWSPV